MLSKPPGRPQVCCPGRSVVSGPPRQADTKRPSIRLDQTFCGLEQAAVIAGAPFRHNPLEGLQIKSCRAFVSRQVARLAPWSCYRARHPCKLAARAYVAATRGHVWQTASEPGHSWYIVVDTFLKLPEIQTLQKIEQTRYRPMHCQPGLLELA